MPTPACNLAGAGVLVTRAQHQSAHLCELIRTHCGHPISFPALEICGPENPEAAQEQLAQLGRFDIAIFISPNAATHCLAMMTDHTPLHRLQIAAVGQATARTLAQAGLTVHISPAEKFDSEALLETPELQQVKNRRIIIFRGNGGRPLLGDTLRQRGAEVVYAEVYRRTCPATDPTKLLAGWPTSVQIVTATSIDILNNLVNMLGTEGTDKLRSTPLLVISTRMQQRAQELGCQKIILAPNADDQSILKALCNWAAAEKSP